jgi:hypothetical protein
VRAASCLCRQPNLQAKGLIPWGAMETLKLISSYAKMASPFLAVILSGWNAYDARRKFWRCAAGVAVTALFIVIGITRAFY